MGILNKFRKIKKEEPVEEKKKPEIQEKIVALPQGKDSFAYSIIQYPHLTEKASDLLALNKYIFKVFKPANKISVKKAVEKLYQVKVKNVSIVNVPPKKITLGKYEGKKPGYKKAIVTLREGYKIERPDA